MNKSTETIHSRAAHIHTQTHTHILTHIATQPDAHAHKRLVLLCHPSGRIVCLRVLEQIDGLVARQHQPSPPPPPSSLANPNCPTPLGNAFRVCFIEHFIALTYGTIKIDLSHSKHKSVAKPKAKQSYNVSLKLLVYSCLSLCLHLFLALWSPLYLYLKVSGPLKRVMDGIGQVANVQLLRPFTSLATHIQIAF